MLRVLVLAVMLRHGFQPSRLGAALVAMISLASKVWILLFDDLSSEIFLIAYSVRKEIEEREERERRETSKEKERE